MLEEMAVCVLLFFWKTVSEFWKGIGKEVNVA